ELGDVRTRERCADEQAPALVDDDPRRPGCAAAVEAAACDALSGMVDGAGVDASRLRRLERVADRRDLRVGEDHAWRARPFRNGVDPRVAAEYGVGCHPGLVPAAVRE